MTDLSVNFKRFFVRTRNETKPIRSVSKTYGIRLVLARVRLDFRLSLAENIESEGWPPHPYPPGSQKTL